MYKRQILDALGRGAEAKIYRDEAKRRANSWLERAAVGDHTALTFDGQGWSLKYNLVWDKLFGLDLLPDSFYSQETKSYLARSNTYGIPLDSRSVLTKSDWLLWLSLIHISYLQCNKSYFLFPLSVSFLLYRVIRQKFTL